jgi:nucleoid-associated protein EbfC
MRDLMGLMKQAAGLQQKMADMQAELDTLEVEGSAGGGAVTIRMTAKGSIKGVSLDAAMMNPGEKEIVEDLIVAAANDARGKAERLMQQRMEEVTKDLPIPPGLKLF